MTTYEDKADDVSDERIAKLLMKRYDECERLEKYFDERRACRYVATRLNVDIERVKAVLACLSYYGED